MSIIKWPGSRSYTEQQHIDSGECILGCNKLISSNYYSLTNTTNGYVAFDVPQNKSSFYTCSKRTN